MLRWVLLAAAGAAGAVARYAVGSWLGVQTFPWATLGVNTVGSLALGAIVARGGIGSPDVSLAVTAGFLGAFTTFSTFSVETTTMVREGRAGTAAVYAAASLLAGLAAAASGYALVDGIHAGRSDS